MNSIKNKNADAGSIAATYRRKEKALRIARKVARETAERRDKQNVRGEKIILKRSSSYCAQCASRKIRKEYQQT